MQKLSKKQYAKVLKHLVDDTGDIDLVIDLFFEFVTKTASILTMPGILEEYEALNRKQKISVVSKTKLDESMLKEIYQIFGENSEVDQRVDPSMIGGVKIQTETHIFDASIRSQLQHLKMKLNS